MSSPCRYLPSEVGGGGGLQHLPGWCALPALFSNPLVVRKPHLSGKMWLHTVEEGYRIGQAETLPSSSSCFYQWDSIKALNPAQKYPSLPEKTERGADFLLLYGVAGGISLDAWTCVPPDAQYALQCCPVSRSFMPLNPLRFKLLAWAHPFRAHIGTSSGTEGHFSIISGLLVKLCLLIVWVKNCALWQPGLCP